MNETAHAQPSASDTQSASDANNNAIDFDTVLRDEKAAIQRLSGNDSLDESQMVGLCFSGGGIRSATFNLGLLQALASRRAGTGSSVLSRVHYLSTVSGGGYIGTWLSGLLCQQLHKQKRAAEQQSRAIDVQQALGDVEALLDIDNPDSRISGTGADIDNAHPVRWLRKYSNYLTPHTGIGSPDFWMMISSYLRNVTVNLVILSLVICALFLTFRIGMSIGTILADRQSIPELTLYLSNGVFVLLGCLIHMQLMLVDSKQPKLHQWQFGDNGLIVIALLTLFVSFMQAAWMRDPQGDSSDLMVYLNALVPAASSNKAGFFVLPFASTLIGIAIGTLLHWLMVQRAQVDMALADGSVLWRYLLVYLMTGSGFFGIYLLLPEINQTTETKSIVTGFIAYAVSVYLVLFFCFYNAMLGWLSNSYEHEWWNRLTAWLWIAALGLGSIFVFSVALPHIWEMYLADSPWWGKGSAMAAGGGTLAAGVKAIFSDSDYKKVGNKILVAIAPGLFVFAILGALALLLDTSLLAIISKFTTIEEVTCRESGGMEELWCRIQIHPANLNQNLGWAALFAYIGGVVGLLLAAVVLSWRADVNLFSLHMFYRNRLVRCYLGASRPERDLADANEAMHCRSARHAHPATNFDADDGLWLNDFAEQLPYHLINTAINNSSAADTDWQNRKAQSFLFSPRYCGYMNSYQPTANYLRKSATGDLYLSAGLAMTVSGAAASPNMGYHSNAAAAFLMSIFNVRLGWWIQNPRRGFANWTQKGPRFGLQYLLSELIGKAGFSNKFVNVSDGGHFENLGVYELLRRKCGLIIASDAECDPEHKFEGLGRLIHLARVDLGATITMHDFGKLALNGTSRFRDGNIAERPYAIGNIVYADGKRTGTLIYIKACIAQTIEQELPVDIINYMKTHADFPQETTADQFFDEMQFESYRKLGEVIGRTLLEDETVREQVPLLA